MNALVHPENWMHLDWVLLVVVAWLSIGVAGAVALRQFKFVVAVLLRTIVALFVIRLPPEPIAMLPLNT